MSQWQFRHGLHELGDGTWAWLQPDGNWGWSNAGLVRDGSAAVLVDTLFDEHLTARMLASMRDASGLAERDIGTIVNTHANGDHCYGNGLLPEANIIATHAGAAEMNEFPPERLAELMRATPQLGPVGEYLQHCFSAFDFEAIKFRAATQSFSGSLQLRVGDRVLDLIEVGPAHTRGDLLVHIPDADIVYTGDILFIDSTPIMWAGPVANWIKACERILALQPAVIVPGHGPLTDADGVRRVMDYLRYIDEQARQRFAAGLDAEAAALDIALGDFGSWGDAERIAVNVATLYREYAGSSEPPDVLELFARMARIRRERSGRPSL